MALRDDDWARQRDSFGRFCDLAAQFNLIAAIEAPVGTLSPVANAFRVIEESGRTNGVVCIDPKTSTYVVRTDSVEDLDNRRRLSPEILGAYGDVRISAT